MSKLNVEVGKRGMHINKKCISQVLPRSGNFLVDFKGPEGEKKGTLEIDEHVISWDHRGQVEAIIFT